MTKRCPKCDGAMVEGAIVNKESNGMRSIGRWLEGPVERSFWVGIKLRGKQLSEIETFRCTRCGLLESYAP